MTHDIPAIMVRTMTGVVVSMSGGFLLASIVFSDIASAYSSPLVVRAERPTPFIDDEWPAPSYAIDRPIPIAGDHVEGLLWNRSS